MLISDGNAEKLLTRESYTDQGELKTKSDDLALVTQSAVQAETFITSKQWGLMWRDADLLYQSPRPMSVFENTYVLEPNVQRFTVAKVVNAITPQLYKGLFYDDPPMLMRPRPGTSQKIVDAKTALFSYLLDDCNFKRETKWGLEQMGLLGTGVWKWGVDYVQKESAKRIASVSQLPQGQDGQAGEKVILNEPPNIKKTLKQVCRPFFEWRSLDQVLFDPHTRVGDARLSKWAIDVKYMDWYEINDLKAAMTDETGKLFEGWSFPSQSELLDCWIPPVNEGMAGEPLEKQVFVQGAVHHAEDLRLSTSPDKLFNKLEVLEYWDANRKIVVLNRKKVLFTGENPFRQIPFLSANWWNRAKAFYGMGLGLIVGQNQRVDQGTINAILKILSFGVNPIYLRKRDSNNLSQMLRTQIGKVLTVDGPANEAFELLETPKVPDSVFSALQESQQATESSSGADQMLVQGSTSGPRTSMGRTAGGAGILANASATRLDGPLDNFIDQVFKPFLYCLDYIVFNYMSDSEIVEILGEEMGKDYVLDMQEFHDGKMEYEVLAGASLAAKRTMSQSLTLITQIFENPQIQKNLAEINGEYIDFKPILNMWMEASEWKNKQDIIKPLTPEMKAKMQQESQAAQAQSKAAVSGQLQQQKFDQKQQLEDQANDNRIKRDIVREAFRNSSMTQAVTGEPSDKGLQGM